MGIGLFMGVQVSQNLDHNCPGQINLPHPTGSNLLSIRRSVDKSVHMDLDLLYSYTEHITMNPNNVCASTQVLYPLHVNTNVQAIQ